MAEGAGRAQAARVYWLSSRVGAGVSGTFLRSVAGAFLRSVAGAFLRSVAGARASGITRNALTWPRSLTTTTVLPATTGAVLMRVLPVETRAASAPLDLSSQCT